MNIKGFVLIGGLAGLFITLSGCASIINGEYQYTPVRTEPSQASVKIYDHNGELVQEATTPFTAELKRGADYFTGNVYKMVVEKPGYDTVEIPLRGEVSGWYYPGILVGWLIFDPSTGAMWNLAPDKKVARRTAQEDSTFSHRGIHLIMQKKGP